MDNLILLLIALFILQVLDAYTTLKVIDLGAKEGNKLTLKLFDTFGMKPVLFVKCFFVLWMGYLAGIEHIYYLAGLVVIYGLVVVNNFIQIHKQTLIN